MKLSLTNNRDEQKVIKGATFGLLAWVTLFSLDLPCVASLASSLSWLAWCRYVELTHARTTYM